MWPALYNSAKHARNQCVHVIDAREQAATESDGSSFDPFIDRQPHTDRRPAGLACIACSSISLACLDCDRPPPVSRGSRPDEHTWKGTVQDVCKRVQTSIVVRSLFVVQQQGPNWWSSCLVLAMPYVYVEVLLNMQRSILAYRYMFNFVLQKLRMRIFLHNNKMWLETRHPMQKHARTSSRLATLSNLIKHQDN